MPCAHFSLCAEKAGRTKAQAWRGDNLATCVALRTKSEIGGPPSFLAIMNRSRKTL
jgi:hypothetical protein